MYKQKQNLDGDAIVREAISYLESKLRKPGEALTSPDMTRKYLRMRLLNRRYEHFAALLLDTRHRVIAYRELFHGTIDAAHVHPRVVVKQALDDHAAAVIVAHNHPSGVAEPSQADLAITRRLRDALGLMDVRLLDHFIVGDEEVVSLAERLVHHLFCNFGGLG